LNTISPIIRATTTLAKRDAGVLAHNSWKLTQDYVRNITQHHTSFKNNAFIFSSAILVVSRIMLSFQSALKARGSGNERYRLTEAFGTMGRELGGFVGSFMTFGLFYGLTRRRLNKHLITNLTTEKLPSLSKGFFKALGREFNAFFKAKQQKILSVNTPFKSKLFIPKFVENTPTQTTVAKLMNLFGNRQQTVAEKAKRLYTVLPIVVGAIPALILSGFMVENFNLKYSEKFFGKLANKKQPQKPTSSELQQPKALDAPLFATSKVQLAHPGGFSGYVNRVQDKRLQQAFYTLSTETSVPRFETNRPFRVNSVV